PAQHNGLGKLLLAGIYFKAMAVKTFGPFQVSVFGITEGAFQSDHTFQILCKSTGKLIIHPSSPLSRGMPLKSRAHSFKLRVSRERYCLADFGSSCPRICVMVVSGVPVTKSFFASRRRSPWNPFPSKAWR